MASTPSSDSAVVMRRKRTPCDPKPNFVSEVLFFYLFFVPFSGDSKAAELARERVRQENREVAREAVSAIVKENTVLVSQAYVPLCVCLCVSVRESSVFVVMFFFVCVSYLISV